MGEGAPRLVASGLRKHYTAEQLEGRRVVVVTNLKPKPMAGFVSHGMVLCANAASGAVEFVDPPADAPIGARLVAEGFTDGEPEEQINPMKKNNAWAITQPDLKTNSEGVACYKDVPLCVGGAPCRVPSAVDSPLS